ncbi:glycoside hydrolase family 65 protein [Edaphobacter aggregans]|uniref:glycoside hydrolase family 65 protein n=1 Tax=Edaphobacter aggregans TaxID=570835 RepID=UPI000689FD91|nr:glycosyl hydrolase family 65 protein [Edaphobacter aggregans]
MLRRQIQTLPTFIYPHDPFRLVEKKFNPGRMAQMETLFALANGYLGIRGTFEEGTPVFRKGTLINGFHETWPINYAESAYGYAKVGQTIVNVPDGTLLRLYVDDEPFDLARATLVDYDRNLDTRTGILSRDVTWEQGSGKRIRIRSRRLVSFEHKHVAAISYEVTLLNSDAPVVISSELVYQEETQPVTGDPRGSRAFEQRVLLPQGLQGSDTESILTAKTRTSSMTLACGMDHLIESDGAYEVDNRSLDERGRVVISFQGTAGQTLQLTKLLTYHTSAQAPVDELAERVDRALKRARALGFEGLASGQKVHLDKFWDRADVEVRGDEELQQVIRFNLFHIYQASARADGMGLPAKGLTGHGYEGQYFWDTEIYVLPFLIYTHPHLARNLLQFRYRMLDAARRRAREVNQRGALFPWRTINGEEASAYFAAGTAQYHINADVAYALMKYVEVTGDTEFLQKEGAEILIETARMWRSLGFYSSHVNGQFCIHGVTGPDEYNTVVNNNAFTNLMARENLWAASRTLQEIRDSSPEKFARLAQEIGLNESEIAEWQTAADHMYVPYDEAKGIHLQDDEFLSKQPWDFGNTPADKYPLLLHFHPLVIYRHNVIKQADIVLAMFLLSHQFSPEQKRRNFDYYDPLTTGDSSLSVSIQSILAVELGYREKALEYGRYALWMDLADVHANVEQGCHIASMGGTWMGLVYGIAGMREQNGRLTFHPRLARIEDLLRMEGVLRIEGLRFNLTIQGQLLTVDIDEHTGQATYHLREGTGLTIVHLEEELKLEPGKPVSRGFNVHKIDERALRATQADSAA